jgi:hypothetical protein
VILAPPVAVLPVEPGTYVITDGPNFTRYWVARPLALRLGWGSDPSRVEYLDSEGRWADLQPGERFTVLDADALVRTRHVSFKPEPEDPEAAA